MLKTPYPPPPSSLARRLRMLLGWALIFLGLPLFLLPIPLSVLCLVPGLALVAADSPRTLAGLQRLERSQPRLYGAISPLLRRCGMSEAPYETVQDKRPPV